MGREENGRDGTPNERVRRFLRSFNKTTAAASQRPVFGAPTERPQSQKTDIDTRVDSYLTKPTSLAAKPLPLPSPLSFMHERAKS